MKYFLIFTLFLSTNCLPAQKSMLTKPVKLTFNVEQNAPQVRHGLRQIKSLQNNKTVQIVDSKADYHITTSIDTINLQAEAYKIEIDGSQVRLSGGDATGLLYGLLQMKEQLENVPQKISAIEEAPTLSFRAIKFNLPWDPYRKSELLTSHIETCRDTNYWHNFLDMMAENRFNKLTLWNMHPFNFMVKTEKYPEACSFSDAEMLEWETFWHSLFRMAKERGIETYLVNWNIFVPKVFSEAHDLNTNLREKNRHTGEGDTSKIIKDYMREAVRATINKYPNLTGLGTTLGEGMGGMTAEEREKWLLETMIAGARQANRKIKFIHRVPLSAGKRPSGSTSVSVEKMTRRTLDTLTCFDGPMNIELKFNWSHGHSSPKLVKVHGGKLTDTYWNPLPSNYYLAWMIRNEDFLILRWGQTDFIRAHLARNVHPYVNGYYVGSETYIPAVDHFTSLAGASYQYAYERQWLFYKTWGRLLYNAQTSDQVFENAFENKFPGIGQTLFSAQSKTSKVPLVIASWFNGWWDFTLYSEGFLGFNTRKNPEVKLLSLKTMGERTPLEPDYRSVMDFIANKELDDLGKITPFELADSVQTFCNQALAEIKNIQFKDNTDLRYEVTDIKAWAHLGLYFSNKLRAAVYYQKYKLSQDKRQHKLAIKWLKRATRDWDNLVEVTKPVYDPMPISHMSYKRSDNSFHWSIIQEQVHQELQALINDEL